MFWRPTREALRFSTNVISCDFLQITAKDRLTEAVLHRQSSVIHPIDINMVSLDVKLIFIQDKYWIKYRILNKIFLTKWNYKSALDVSWNAKYEQRKEEKRLFKTSSLNSEKTNCFERVDSQVIWRALQSMCNFLQEYSKKLSFFHG